MATLLILGAKPDPVLPPISAWDDLACANASGFSAAKLGLPDPVFTAITAMLTAGVETGRQSMQAMHGLHTGTLYFLYSTSRKTSLRQSRPVKFLRALSRAARVTPAYFQWAMSRAGYRWDHFVAAEVDSYVSATRNWCKAEEELFEQAASKRPSTGLIALLIGLSLNRYDRFILSGFSFELTHAYAENPAIHGRGTRESRHMSTDIRFMQCLSSSLGNLFTTEPTVNQLTGVPLLDQGN
jgi:hypothetical protein